MHIVNLMFSVVAGGIEQAFVDYCDGHRRRGHEVTAITHPAAAVNPALRRLGVRLVTLRNFGKWDAYAVLRLRRRLKSLGPDIIIAHANRSLFMARRAAKNDWPLVGVAHNYSTRLLSGIDGVFATTHDLIRHVTEQGVEAERIFHIPNMIRCDELPDRTQRSAQPHIGTLGRFVKKKGFDVYIDALKILRQRGYRFHAILGGSGAEEARLKKRAAEAGLNDCLAFPGWVKDKRAFYSSLDMFCLPSLHEPFGIVLLEAFIYGTPVVATDSEGPRDIITHNFNALIVRKGDAQSLADAMAKLLDDPNMAEGLAANAFAHAKTAYDIERVAARIETALQTIRTRWEEASD